MSLHATMNMVVFFFFLGNQFRISSNLKTKKRTPTSENMSEWLNLAESGFWPHYVASNHRLKRFRTTFECSPKNCVTVWCVLVMSGQLGKTICDRHFLWMLYFLKHYQTMEMNASMVGTSKRTFRAKVFHIIEVMGNLVFEFVSTNLPLFF